MKQQIMEKLFAEKPLTNEEILYIGSRLDDNDAPKVEEGAKRTRRKKTTVLPYDHSNKESLTKACSLTDADFESINKLIRSEVLSRKDELTCDSKVIEVYEKIGLAKPQNFRLLMYQFVRMKHALEKRDSGMGGIGIRLGGGGFGDFLDFLRRGGH
jgi:hypothetical protein